MKKKHKNVIIYYNNYHYVYFLTKKKTIISEILKKYQISFISTNLKCIANLILN